MSLAAEPVYFAGWARSAVTPLGAGFRKLHAHEIAAPVLQSLLARAGLAPGSIDAVVLGNALGAGGNPARMLSFAAGLPDACSTFSVDTQCCSGLDAVALGAGLIRSGQASVVVAGGVEAWSRSPIRQVRPLNTNDIAVTYERPPFCPDPARDPDLLISAAEYAWREGFSRADQDAYALDSHERALSHVAEMVDEIVPVAGAIADTYPRAMTRDRAARLPAQVAAGPGQVHALSPLAISAKADGAALVLLASAQACERYGLSPQLTLRAQVSLGVDPVTPLLAADRAVRAVLEKAGLADARALTIVELHDAFAVQGLGFCRSLGLMPQRINRCGGGLARGHPIGASGAVALVRALADLARNGSPGAFGVAAIAGAGGLGSAVMAQCC